MITVIEVPFNIIRGFVRLAFNFIIFITVQLIRLFTYEPGKKRVITVRKARRIRTLTNLKLWFFNTMPDSVTNYLGKKYYKEYLFSHLGYGLQLRDEGTDRCAV